MIGSRKWIIFIVLFILIGFIFIRINDVQNKKVYSILCLGESTTAQGDNFSWPAQLERVLNKNSSEMKFKVVNAGENSVFTTRIVRRVGEYLNRYNPDLVIVMMGINDTFATKKYEKGLFNDVNEFVHNSNKTVKMMRQRCQASECYIEKAKNYENEGKYNEAKKIYENLLEIDKNSFEAYLNLGRLFLLYENIGDENDAEKMFKKALELYPDNAEANSFLAGIYFSQKKYLKSDRYFQRAIEL